MDYEKKYNEALKRAEAAINIAADKDLVKGVATTIFPELAESEEEKIRREIVDFICWAIDRGSITEEQRERSDTWLAYLEKQKEQPTNEEMLRTLRAEYEKGVADTIAKYEQKEQKEIPLMNGDADLYFDNWIQHNDTTKRGCFEEGIRYAQRLQKDVKVKYVYPKFRIGDIISNNKPEPGFINDYTIVGFNNELPDYLVDGGNVPSCSIGIEFIDSNYHLKEQKPADLSEMMVHKEPYIAPVPTPMVADEQKPVKWSEEDKKKIGRLRSVVNQLASYTDSLDVNGDYCEGDYAELDAWLKLLPLKRKIDGFTIEEFSAISRAIELLYGSHFEIVPPLKDILTKMAKYDKGTI